MIEKDNEIIKLKAELEHLKTENNLKTGWISLISHDFKEAFSSLHWLLQSLEDKSISASDFYELLPRIKQDAKKNLVTITDTTDWIKTQQKGFTPQLTEIFAVELYARLKLDFKEKIENKQLQFIFQGDETCKITTDRILLNYILNKILDNAIKYSHLGKSIYFKISNNQQDVTLSIIDFGTGMNEKRAQKIFSFNTAVFSGTNGEIGAGIGLKIVQKFVYLIDGILEINSAENEGTTISVTIPLIENK